MENNEIEIAKIEYVKFNIREYFANIEERDVFGLNIDNYNPKIVDTLQELIDNDVFKFSKLPNTLGVTDEIPLNQYFSLGRVCLEIDDNPDLKKIFTNVYQMSQGLDYLDNIPTLLNRVERYTANLGTEELNKILDDKWAQSKFRLMSHMYPEGYIPVSLMDAAMKDESGDVLRAIPQLVDSAIKIEEIEMFLNDDAYNAYNMPELKSDTIQKYIEFQQTLTKVIEIIENTAIFPQKGEKIKGISDKHLTILEEFNKNELKSVKHADGDKIIAFLNHDWITQNKDNLSQNTNLWLASQHFPNKLIKEIIEQFQDDERALSLALITMAHNNEVHEWSHKVWEENVKKYVGGQQLILGYGEK